MARTEHFIGLEWLRFLLAIYVVLFHTVHAYVEDEPTWLSGAGRRRLLRHQQLLRALRLSAGARLLSAGRTARAGAAFSRQTPANLYPLHLFSLLLTAIVLTIIAKLGIPPDDAKASLRYVVYDTNEELSGEARDALGTS